MADALMQGAPESNSGGAARRRTALVGGVSLLLWSLGSAAFWAPRIERKLTRRAGEALAEAGVRVERAEVNTATSPSSSSAVGVAKSPRVSAPERDPQAEIARLLAGRPIAFAPNEEGLSAATRSIIDDVVAYLARNPEIELEIGGYSDSRGGLERNLEISRRRAEAVRGYLVERGIRGERLRAVGYGPARPIADNDTMDGRRANRRVELTVESCGS